MFNLDFGINLALFLTILVPIVGSFFVLFNSSLEYSRVIAQISSIFVFISVIYIWAVFDLVEISGYFCTLYILGYEWVLKLDGVSLAFIFLTSFLMPICLLSIQGSADREKEYIIALLILQSFMETIFLVQDLLIFYIFFESVLIPMYFIIGGLGSRLRRIYASYMLLLYTIFGSIPMLFSLLHIYSIYGTLNLDYLLTNVSFDFSQELFYWIAFFLGFAVKVPMLPFHIWLPEAHVEAPTAGSVILAGVLLKLGTYGFLRILIPLFPYGSEFFSPFVQTLSVLAIIYTSLTTLRQVDLKKIIAYSSVAHMGYVTLGLFSFTTFSIEGSILIMFSHGFVASALFLCIGIVYDRYKTRIYKYYSGFVQTMPIFTTIFLFFIMANLGLPGTSSFPGEFLVTVSSFDRDALLAIVASFGTILSAAYSLWLFNRIAFGVSKTSHIYFLSDITLKETLCLFPLIFATIIFGVYPDVLIKLVHPASLDLLNIIAS